MGDRGRERSPAMNSRKHVSTTRKVANFSSRSLDSHAGSERTIPRLGNSYFGFGNQDAHRSSVNALVMDRSLLEPLQLDLDPNIRAVKVQEKEQIKTLNDRFASFINKVCHLEQQNKMLETKLRLLQSGPQTQSNMESVFKMYIGNLESQLKNLNTSKELLKAKLWNSRSLVEENKHKYEEEINKRYKAENDFVSIKKDADAGYFGRINLEEERSEIQQHLDFFKALYAEEVRELKEQLKDTSVVVEMDNSRQLNMEQVVKEVKSQYEEVSARSRQEAEAWYQKKELSFRGHDESAGSNDRGNYVELLCLIAESNTDLHYHLSTNKVFSGTSGKIQNDLITAIAEVMGEEIRSEVKKAPFVSVMVDETTDASNAAQLALVLRYVTGTGVKERFVRFEDVTGGKRADDIAGLIIGFLLENECLGKVVAQCFDGAAVMSSGLNGVQAKVKERAPLALFIHCYAHRLNLVLTQGASKLKECKIFFGHLNGLAAFFYRLGARNYWSKSASGVSLDKKLDVQSCLARVKEFCDTVERGRSRYEELYEATERTAGAPSARRGQAQDPHYRQLHGRILDNIICQTQTRFQDHEKLMFVTLLDPQKFQEYKKKFLHAAFSSLIQSHGALFDLSRLKTELIVMYAMDDFTGKSPTDLLDFLHQKNLSESMGQLYTLFELVSSQVEQHSSEMKRAKSEISELKRLITKLQADIAMVKAECKSTDGRIEEAEHRGEEAVFGAKRKLKELQEAHLKAKQGMARQVHEYQDLMNIKMALDIEISTYKKLLEGEEQRTGPVIRVQSVTKPSHPQPVDVITCTNVLIKMIDTRDKSNISVKD
ncbi:hypothetical protein QTP86_030551 [Hemibagrus guttatus]|nr:hypothetical protein QTP86_030551 [Hemibagrus guttatus]